MKDISVKALAKINLGLDVYEKERMVIMRSAW